MTSHQLSDPLADRQCRSINSIGERTLGVRQRPSWQMARRHRFGSPAVSLPCADSSRLQVMAPGVRPPVVRGQGEARCVVARSRMASAPVFMCDKSISRDDMSWACFWPPKVDRLSLAPTSLLISTNTGSATNPMNVQGARVRVRAATDHHDQTCFRLGFSRLGSSGRIESCSTSSSCGTSRCAIGRRSSVACGP